MTNNITKSLYNLFVPGSVYKIHKKNIENDKKNGFEDSKIEKIVNTLVVNSIELGRVAIYGRLLYLAYEGLLK